MNKLTESMYRKPNPIGLDLISFAYFILGIINIFLGFSIFTSIHPILIDLSGFSRLLRHLSIVYSGASLIILGLLQIAISYGLSETKVWAFILALTESTANMIATVYTLLSAGDSAEASIIWLIINMIITVYLICRFPRKKREVESE